MATKHSIFHILPTEQLLLILEKLPATDFRRFIRIISRDPGLRVLVQPCLLPLLYSTAIKEDKGVEALCWAARIGNLEVATRLLEKYGANIGGIPRLMVSFKGHTALHFASEMATHR